MERRMFERISLPIKLAYEVLTRPKIVREGISKNISGGGICLSLNERLLPRTLLNMKIELGGKGDTITLKGEVVWNRKIEIVEKAKPIIYYETGIRFIDADPININRVISHFHVKSF